MKTPDNFGTYVHVHLVSDSTGETLSGVARAVCAQFPQIVPIEHAHTMVRSPRQLEQVQTSICRTPGLVLFTLVNPELRSGLVNWCNTEDMPSIDVLEPFLSRMSQILGTPVKEEVGAQHTRDEDYFQRIDALNFAMVHDDGQQGSRLRNSDVILLGVSRTSKTPTCVYLANRGIKAANVPVVPGAELPDELAKMKGPDDPLVVGLTISPKRLVQIRRNRLLSLKEQRATAYVNEEEVRNEVIFAKRLFSRHQWPVIDVTRRSIEETSARIMALLQERREAKEDGLA